jgi:hypothetical protein
MTVCGGCGQGAEVGHRCDGALVGARLAREAADGLNGVDTATVEGRQRAAAVLARLSVGVNDARLDGALDRAMHARCMVVLDGYVEMTGLSWDDVAAAQHAVEG